MPCDAVCCPPWKSSGVLQTYQLLKSPSVITLQLLQAGFAITAVIISHSRANIHRGGLASD